MSRRWRCAITAGSTQSTSTSSIEYLAQRRKQQETLRDRQRDRSKRSRPKREREQAERREAATAQTAAKAIAAKAAVVDAARQRAAAEQRLAALKQRACA